MISHGSVEIQRVPALAVTLPHEHFPPIARCRVYAATVARLRGATARSGSRRAEGLVEQRPKAHAGFIKLIGRNEIILLYV